MLYSRHGPSVEVPAAGDDALAQGSEVLEEGGREVEPAVGAARALITTQICSSDIA